MFGVVLTIVLLGAENNLSAAEKVANHLQDISVTIKTGNAEGSGVIKTRIINGKKINFVWTAAHVIDGLRRQEEVVDPATGTKRQLIRYDDARIVKELNENGRRVGELAMDARVIKVNYDEDLALLRIWKTGFIDASVEFYLDTKIPPIGTKLLHVGSLLGQLGSNSMTSGIQSQIGRVLSDGKEYDQTTVTAFPGSSGGGVYLEDGRYVGMVVRGAGESFNLIIPVRRMVKWATKCSVLWAIDDKVSVPKEEDLEKMPIEDIGVNFNTKNTTDMPKTLIRTPESKNTTDTSKTLINIPETTIDIPKILIIPGTTRNHDLLFNGVN